MLELFSVLLTGAVTGAAEWATRYALDAVVGCPSCNHEHRRSIANFSSNNLLCPTCYSGVGQYSVATDKTVLPGNKLMGANIFNPKWEMQHEGFLARRHTRNWFLLDVSSIGMQHHGMVVTAEFETQSRIRNFQLQKFI
jgi:hypothetical protein